MHELKIIAAIIVKPEYKNELLPIFEKTVNESRKEIGCVSYELHQDIKNPLKYIIIEIWKNQEAIDIHNASKHFQSFVAAIDGKVEDLKIDTLKKIY